MCGIFGAVGHRPCVTTIFEGLRTLEYRGYDSAGIATAFGGRIDLVKQSGKLARLEPELARLPAMASVGMGHTRWATHGRPTTMNAHPHVTGKVAIIHNGIIENYAELKADLVANGTSFQSETDTEVVLQLLARQIDDGMPVGDALHHVLPMLRGAFALGVLLADKPDTLYVVKQGSPLVIGMGDGATYFASDALALVRHTNRLIFLEDGEIAILTPTSATIRNFAGQPVERPEVILDWQVTSADKHGYRHYMLKEIHDQPAMVANTLTRFVSPENQILSAEMGLSGLDLEKVRRVHLVACGTAYHAAMLGRYFIETLTNLPVNVELASEFRYRQGAFADDVLLVALTQSGETADTLACVKYARSRGAQVLSICNVRFSSVPRASTATLYMDAGSEICVASTKAFTSMILCLYLFGLEFGRRHGFAVSDATFSALRALPLMLDRTLAAASAIDAVVAKHYESTNAIYMGRGLNFPLALEGALKTKEISYIHAEGYAGGELKHGPIALIDPHMVVIAIAPQDKHYEKMISNIEEVCARQGRVIGIGALDDTRLKTLCTDYIGCPKVDDEVLQAMVTSIPLQLYAYFAAVHRGTDVDQPRNLAKSVTVE